MSELLENVSSFESLGLKPELCQIVKELGYEVPTPIQIKSIPVILSGRDLIGQAQTGTGKTAAFALPLLNKIRFDVSGPQVLVLTPTRELAIQVAEAFKSYARKQKNFHVLPIYGGQAISLQLRQLDRRPQVIVGTPGRVMDHLRRKSLSLASLSALVIDEADEMLSMGFIEDIQWIIEQSPKDKQMTLFSATMPRAIRQVAQSCMRDPDEIVIKQMGTDAVLIEQTYWMVSGLHKLDALTRILEVSEVDATLIFVRTKTATVELAEKLDARGYSVGALNGDMSQDARERTVERLKKGKLDILIATDVAARGLHVERISHVINYDIPFDAETYTHRIGRTGRAGKTGSAILFVSPRERGLLRSIERSAGKDLKPFKMPSKEDISQRRTDRFIAKVEAVLGTDEITPFLPLVESIAAKLKQPEATIAAAVCALLQQEAPFLAESKDDRDEMMEEAQQAPRRFDQREERVYDPRKRPMRSPRPGRQEREGGRSGPPPQRGGGDRPAYAGPTGAGGPAAKPRKKVNGKRPSNSRPR